MESHTELFLRFWLQNNEFIIQWLTLALVLALLYWLISIYFRPSDLQPTESTSPTMRNSTTIPHSFPKHQEANPLLLRMNELKRELRLKDSEMDKLKEQLKEKTLASDKEVESKIQELEKKLAQYTIIEDDLANLSRYKEEVKELKAQLDKRNHKA